MALSDYNTAVEKIAALKAAQLDSALVQIKGDNSHDPYTVTEEFDYS